MNHERVLRRLRNRIFHYQGDQSVKADRVLRKVKNKVLAAQKQQKGSAIRGPYSGLTRSELAKTGTCETDWV